MQISNFCADVMQGLSISCLKNRNSFTMIQGTITYLAGDTTCVHLHPQSQLFPAPPLLPPGNHPHFCSLPHPTPLDGQQVTTTKSILTLASLFHKRKLLDHSYIRVCYALPCGILDHHGTLQYRLVGPVCGDVNGGNDWEGTNGT